MTEERRQQRHTDVYRTPGLPAFEYSQIETNLYAGRNPLTGIDVQTLASAGVTHLLDLREPFEWTAPRFGEDALAEAARLGLQRVHLPITDMGAPTPEALNEAVRLLTASPEAIIYVHCRAGMERTAAVLIAHRAVTAGCTYEEALAHLRTRRPILNPLPVQERAVRAWLDAQRAGA